MKILITGNRGFIGSNLSRELKDHTLYYFDKGDKLPEHGVNLVYHLAADANAYASIEDPSRAKNNIDVMLEVLEWMRKTGTKQMIFASSREVFDVNNPYGASKAAGESLLQSYCNSYGFKGLSVRIANVYGKGNLDYRFIENTIEKARQDKDIKIYGKEKILNFIHISDCINGLMLSMEMLKQMNNSYDIVELAHPSSVSLVILADFIIKITGSKSKIKVYENRSGETLQYIPRSIQFPTKIGLEQGVRLCL